MDFMKLLRSFEEFLFEAASWLVFYPLTLWRVLTKPLQTMAYSDAEQLDDETHRYDDALTPPLFLLITIVLLNLIGLALHTSRAASDAPIQHAVLGSMQNAIVFRTLVFSLIPLVAAASLLRRQGVRLSRESLRAPFYAQCYLAGPCAVFVSGGLMITQRQDISNAFGAALALGGLAWFLTAQTRWFAQRLGTGLPRAALTAAWALLRALVYLFLVMAPVALL